ncbi:MAG: hypothetical protein FJ202_07010 [Gemmatimonadetes bacterium]|nr:hypothetical protein [Gemmatimonadota bacterium]
MSRLPLARTVLAGLAVAAGSAQAQRPVYGPTMFWESGLVNIPAAYVAPLGGDLNVSFTRLNLSGTEVGSAQLLTASQNIALSASLWGRAEAGISVFSGDLRNGFFAKAMLVDETDGIWRRGLRHWLPSVAVGVRNLGTEKQLDRLALTGNANVSTAPSMYGVATRTFVLAKGTDAAHPKLQVGLTAGYGTGLFKDDGGLGERYAAAPTGGAFGGAVADIALGRNSSLTLMAEQDAWDVNAGVRLDVRGLRIAYSIIELGAAEELKNGITTVASRKSSVTIGWQTNILSLVRGNRLEERTARTEQAQGDLQRQVQIAQQRIDAISGQLDALRVVTGADRAAERAALERQLREEQDTLKRLQDLIKNRKPPE